MAAPVLPPSPPTGFLDSNGDVAITWISWFRQLFQILKSLGTAAYQAATAFDIAGAAAAAQAASDPLGSAAAAQAASDPLGSAAAAQAASDPVGSAATVQAASLQKANDLSDVTSVSISRTNLGLGTAATQNTTAFDAAGTAAAAIAAAITSTAPANSASTGVKGTIAYDAGFLYIAVAANSWRRVATVTF
jgi:hypothetical protein